MGASGSELFLLWGVLLACGSLKYVAGNHATGQCVQIGQANSNAATIGTKYVDILDASDPAARFGPYTIGAKKFDTNLFFLDFILKYTGTWDRSVNDCPYEPLDIYPGSTTANHLYADPCPSDEQVEIRTYAVKQDGRPMAGWLHVEVELMNKSDSILGIYVQMRDENFNAVGEFVEKEEEQCPQAATGVTLATQNSYQVLPCSAIGAREPRVSHALFMVDKSILSNKTAGEPFLPNASISRGIHFTWRMSEYWCNRHLHIRPEAIIITDAVRQHGSKYFNPSNQDLPERIQYNAYPRIMRKATGYWIHPGFYGAADIKLPRTTLTCKDQVVNNKNGERMLEDDGSLVAPWLLNKTTKSVLKNDYLHPDNTYNYNKTGTPLPVYKTCQFDTREDILKPGSLPTFAGRCVHFTSKEASHDQQQSCEFDESAPQFEDIFNQYPDIQNYGDYVNELTHNRTRYCKVKCRLPSTDRDVKAIKGFPDNSSEKEFSYNSIYHSDNRQASRIEKFFVGRKYHGLLCSFCSIFLIPVSLFVARYLKETFMTEDCMGIQFWYWMHTATAFAAMTLFISSLAALWSNISTWGRSLHIAGVLHQVVGYFSFSVFCLMIFLGGLRGLNTGFQKASAMAHSIIGFLVHFLNYAAIILSCFIPASPTLVDCDMEGNAKGISYVLVLAVVWMVGDVAAHTCMTFLQVYQDRRMAVSRGWYCPIFPLLPHDARSDFIGTRLRKIITMAYSGAAFIFAIVISGLIQGSLLPERCQVLMGELSCKKEYGCSSSAVLFAARVSTESVVLEATYSP